MTDAAVQAAPVRAARWGWVIDLIGPVSLAIAASVVVGFVVEKRVEKRFAQALSPQPGVAVVDDIGLVRLAIENGADRYNPQAVAAEIERLVNEAGLANTVLISQSMVLYSPEDARIQVAQPKPTPPARPVLGGSAP